MKYNQIIRYVEPKVIQKGRACRLGGVDFLSVAQACRYWGLSYSTAMAHVESGKYEEHPRKKWKSPLEREEKSTI